MKNIHWWKTHIGKKESSAIINAIKDKKISMGSITQEFENNISRLLSTPYVVATPSGSISLYMALKVLGIGIGDEVIVPDRTFIATAHAVKLTGATVILVDCNKYDTNIDTSKIEEKITSKTKAIIPVHLNGRSVNFEKLNIIAKEYKLKIIEDSCQSLFSKNKEGEYLGTLSDIGCFSLGMAKLITVGFGGLVICKNKKTYKKLIKLRNHGKIDNTHTRYNSFGFNFKVTDISSAIGKVQLLKYKDKVAHCKKIYLLYHKALRKLDFIDLIKVNIEYQVPLYIEVVSKDRKEIIKHLNKNNINTNYLPPSLHLSKHLKQKTANFKNSLYYNNNSFILPSGPNQDIANIKKVIKTLKVFNYD